MLLKNKIRKKKHNLKKLYKSSFFKLNNIKKKKIELRNKIQNYDHKIYLYD